jgi:hypothetical protein
MPRLRAFWEAGAEALPPDGSQTSARLQIPALLLKLLEQKNAGTPSL